MRNDRRFGSEQDTPMFSVIFEVLPRQGRKEEYLDLAKGLRPILEKMDGFVDVERYESRTRPGWVLSQSTWRDEKSMVRWRTQRDHYFVQSKGRFEVFADYHLRIGEITADTDPPAGLVVLEQRFDETEVGVAKLVTLTEATPERGADLTAKADRLPFTLASIRQAMRSPSMMCSRASTIPESWCCWRPGRIPMPARRGRPGN
jgi:heme-degrading monooxygenase HmoA